jgi:enoyl-CoA hydratase
MATSFAGYQLYAAFSAGLDFDGVAFYAVAISCAYAEEVSVSFDNIVLTVEEKMAIITINRPDVRNALDLKTVQELHAALDSLRANEQVAVVILTGAGDKAFVSGADIRDLKVRTKRDALGAINTGLFSAIENFDRPTIAAVNGFALGGGCELALCCDLRVASENARFGLPETGLGIIPGAGGTQRLPRLIGWGRAKELILTGDIIDAARAEQIGLVSKVVPRAALLDAAKEIARKIISRGPLAIRLAKLALNLSAQVNLNSGLVFEMLAQAITFESKDKLEGMTAFLEKRKPEFKGE